MSFHDSDLGIEALIVHALTAPVLDECRPSNTVKSPTLEKILPTPAQVFEESPTLPGVYQRSDGTYVMDEEIYDSSLSKLEDAFSSQLMGSV